MSGIKGKSGRKKTSTSLINEALDSVDQELPNIFEALIKRAIEGDREAQIYLIDRRLGKPKASIDIEGGEELGSGLVAKLFQLLASKRRELEASEYPQIEANHDNTT